MIGLRHLDPTRLSSSQKIALAKTGLEFESHVDALPDLLVPVANATPEELDKLNAHLEAQYQQALAEGTFAPAESEPGQSPDKSPGESPGESPDKSPANSAKASSTERP